MDSYQMRVSNVACGRQSALVNCSRNSATSLGQLDFDTYLLPFCPKRKRSQGCREEFKPPLASSDGRLIDTTNPLPHLESGADHSLLLRIILAWRKLMMASALAGRPCRKICLSASSHTTKTDRYQLRHFSCEWDQEM